MSRLSKVCWVVGFAVGSGLLVHCVTKTQPKPEPESGPFQCASRADEPTRDYVLPEHRATAGVCESSRPCSTIWRRDYQCSSHDDCSAGENGRCSFSGECSYDECFSDDDCAPGALCDCAGGPDRNHVCFAVECRTDDDCVAGMWCSPSGAIDCPDLKLVGYYCHTPADDCMRDADCDSSVPYCAFDPSRRAWSCVQTLCIR